MNAPNLTTADVLRIDDVTQLIRLLKDARVNLDEASSTTRSVPALSQYLGELMANCHELQQKIESIYDDLD